MRAFISRITSSNNTNEGGGSVFSRGGGANTDKQNRQNRQNIYASIEECAKWLAFAIDNIVNNKSSLSGDNSIGWERLLQILDGSTKKASLTPTDLAYAENGIGCVDYLLEQRSIDKFVELCNRTNLAESLIHSFRLLRVFEFKLSSSRSSSSSYSRGRNSSLSDIDASPGSEQHPMTPGSSIGNGSGGIGGKSPSSTSLAIGSASSFETSNSHVRSASPISFASEAGGGIGKSPTSSSSSIMSPGVTKAAAERVFNLLDVLLSNSQTKEKLRESLPKFFIYPLLLFSPDAIHLQQFAGRLVGTACGSGLTGSQISFLRDTGLMPKMVDELKVLISFNDLKTMTPETSSSSSSSPSTSSLLSDGGTSVISATSLPFITTSSGGNDTMLKGLAAEKAGMWLTAIECVVKIISASFCIGPVLLDDLKLCGGFLVISKLLEFSSGDNLSKELKLLTQIFNDHSRGFEGSICYVQAGEVFNELLLTILGLKRRISNDDNFEKLLTVCKHLFDRKSKVVNREVILKCLASALLSLYSADIKSCVALEDTYCFAPLLLLTLPAMDSHEVILAIITTFKFVCANSKEESVNLYLTTFSAVFTASVNFCLTKSLPDPQNIGSLSYQIDVLFKSFDGIIKHNSKYALQFMKCGLLSNLICVQFRDLCEFFSFPSNKLSIEAERILSRMIPLLINASYQSSSVAEVISNSGLVSYMKNIILSDQVNCEFVFNLIQLPKSLGLVQPEDNLLYLINICEVIDVSDYRRCNCIQAMQFILLSISNDVACAVWLKIEGKRFIKSNFSRLGGNFGVDPSSDENCFLCLKELFKLVTIDMNLFFPMRSSEGTNDDRRREYFIFIKEVTSLLFASNVFKSKDYTKRCLDDLLELAVGARYSEGSNRTLLYPDFLRVVMIVFLNLDEDDQVYTVNEMIQIVESVLFAGQLFCERGIIRILLANFYDKIRDPSNKVGVAIWTLVDLCMGKYLLVEDFTALFYFLIRPSLLQLSNSYCSPGYSNGSMVAEEGKSSKDTSNSSSCSSSIDQKLLPPWLAVCNSTTSGTTSSSEDIANSSINNSNKTPYWKYLQTLATSSIDLSDVPAIPLGSIPSRSETDPAYITCLIQSGDTSPAGKDFTFPSYAFTTSVWFRMPNNRGLDKYLTGRTVLFSLGAVSTEVSKKSSEGVFQVEYSRNNNCFYVLLKKGTSFEFKKFMSIVDSTTWTSIVVAYKKAKKSGFTAHKACLLVFINGVPALPCTCDIDIDIPTARQEIDLSFGIISVDMELDATQGPESLTKYWELGPFLLFEDVLNASQAAALFLRGPCYAGTMQANSPLSNSLYSQSSFYLRNISHCISFADSRIRESLSIVRVPHEALTDIPGIKGFEALVDPQLGDFIKEYSSTSMSTNKFKGFESLSAPILAFSSSNLFGLTVVKKVKDLTLATKDNMFEHLYNIRSERFYFTNAKSFESTSPAAELINSEIFFNRRSFGGCIGNIGGPSVLLPILQHASTSEEIVYFLSLLKVSINDNVANLEFMHRVGFRLVAFLLAMKPKALITTSVIDELFKLTISKYKDDASDHMNILLVDSSAFYYLILNHQIWDSRRFTYVVKIVDMMLNLCQDARFGSLNTKMLSALGVCKWVLLLCEHGTEQAGVVGPEKRSGGSSKSSSSSSSSSSGGGGDGSSNSGSGSSASDDWIFVSISSDEMADNEDQQDLFLRSATRLVILLISFDVRKEDLDLISHLIIYSFQSNDHSLFQYETEDIIGSVFSFDRDIMSPPPSNVKSSNSDSASTSVHGSVTIAGSNNNSSGGDDGRVSPIPTLGADRPLSSSIAAANKSSKVLAPALIRVYLLQMLYFLYDELSVVLEKRNEAFLSLFRKSFSMDWFLSILQSYADVSTRGYCMRLIGLVIQKDDVIKKDLYLKNQYRAIDYILSRQPESLAVVLPILGLLCGIPMNLLPFPNHLRGGGPQKIIQLIENVGDVTGPDCSDPVLEEFTLPLLSLLLNCISKITHANNVSQKVFCSESEMENASCSANSASIVIDVIVGVLSIALAPPPSAHASMDKRKGDNTFASIRNTSFRDLFQFRRSIELLTQSLIACSNAIDDVDNSTPPAVDLASLLSDNYIFEDGSFEGDSTRFIDDGPESAVSDTSDSWEFIVSNETAPGSPEVKKRRPSFRISSVSDPKADKILKEGIKLSSDGVKILDIVIQVIRNSITEHSNSVALCQFLLSYPDNLRDIFVSEFQLLVFDSVISSVDLLILQNNNFKKVLANITDMFSQIVSVAKARLINVKVLACILKRVLSIIEKLRAHAEMSEDSENRYLPVINDLALTAKAYSIIIVQSFNVDKVPLSFKRDILHTIRASMNELGTSIHASTESNTFFKGGFNRMKGMSLDSAATFVDAFVASWAALDSSLVARSLANSAKKTTNDLLSISQAERQKFCQIFIVAITSACLNYSLDESEDMSNEALKMLCVLLIKYRDQMEQLFSEKNFLQKSTKLTEGEKEIFEGLLRLLPPSSYVEVYCNHLGGFGSENFGEENRFRDFKMWIRESAVKFGIIETYEPYLKNLLATASPERLIKVQSKLHLHTGGEDSSVALEQDLQKRTRTIKKTDDLVHSLLHTWSIHGINELGGSLLSWKKEWDSLQSGVIWGYLPFGAIIGAAGRRRSVSSGEGKQNNGNLLSFTLKSVADSLHSKAVDFVSNADNLTIFPKYKGWKLDLTVGVENMKRKVEPFYLHPAQVTSSAYHLIEGGSNNSAPVTSKSLSPVPSLSPVVSRPISMSLLSPSRVFDGTPTRVNDSNESNDLSSSDETLADSSGDGLFTPDASSMTPFILTPVTSPIKASESLENMEDFLKKMTQQGVLKRSNAMFIKKSVDSNVEDIADSETTAHSNENSAQNLAELQSAQEDVEEEDFINESAVTSAVGDGTSSVVDSNRFSRRFSAPLTIFDTPSAKTRVSVLDSSQNDNKYGGDGNNKDKRPPDTPFFKRAASLAALEVKDTIISTKSSIILEILRGMIGPKELINSFFINVNRVSGLEVIPSILIVSISKIHLIEGIAVKDKDATKSPDKKTFEWLGDTSSEIDKNIDGWTKKVLSSLLNCNNSIISINFEDVYSTFKRRYQLKYSALEISTINGYSIVFACGSVDENDSLLKKFFESKMPNNIFHKIIDSLAFNTLNRMRGTKNLYNRVISIFLRNQTKLWQAGEISNFEYLTHLNSVAGRSLQDLTQYPVFPWVIADYSSLTLDLNDPKTFRDLSKPMGAAPNPVSSAAGEKRRNQFLDRYRTMDDFYKEGIDDTQVPFHYGTHYSCTGYVLNYLIRLEPYSAMAASLQGGSYDKADRLFNSIKSSWLSASQENLQDVRELTPEFYYLKEFLSNSNNYDFGITQKGEVINDVELPIWAHNDPRTFVRINRQALESKYVSENLHNWIDLIFGYKQRGAEAEESMNVFIHLTYDGEVDVDAIDDEVLKIATIAQINNFGQTPALLFEKPHPKRVVPDIVQKTKNWTGNESGSLTVDSSAINWHAHISAPFCVVGAEYLHELVKSPFKDTLYVGSTADFGSSTKVGDIKVLSKDKVLTLPIGCTFLPNNLKHYLKYSGITGSLALVLFTTERANRAEQDYTANVVFEEIHFQKLTATAVSSIGDLVVTGSEDCSLRVWKLSNSLSTDPTLNLLHTLFGHTSSISCIDISSVWNIIVSGSTDQSLICWDAQTGRLRFILPNHNGTILAVSINQYDGNIICTTATNLYIYSINGDMISYAQFARFTYFRDDIVDIRPATTCVATNCPDWKDGVVAITGHEGGHFILWKFSGKSDSDSRYLRKSILTPKSDDDDPDFLVISGNHHPNQKDRLLSTASATSSVSSAVSAGGTNTDTNVTSSSGDEVPVVLSMNKHVKRRIDLCIANIPPKMDADICILKLGSSCSAHHAANKDLTDTIISTGADEDKPPDLIVGDTTGALNKYNLMRLDQVSQSDLPEYLKSERE